MRLLSALLGDHGETWWFCCIFSFLDESFPPPFLQIHPLIFEAGVTLCADTDGGVTGGHPLSLTPRLGCLSRYRRSVVSGLAPTGLVCVSEREKDGLQPLPGLNALFLG